MLLTARPRALTRRQYERKAVGRYSYADHPYRIDLRRCFPVGDRERLCRPVGEKRSFDHVFATYVPKKGEKVWNLLSEGIVNKDGTPGPNFSKAEQNAAKDQAPDAFLLSPDKDNFQGTVLPAPLAGGPADSFVKNDSLSLAKQSENGLPADYYGFLVTGGTGLTSKTPDTRIKSVNALP